MKKKVLIINKKKHKKILKMAPKRRNVRVVPQRTKISWSISNQLNHYIRIMGLKAFIKRRRVKLRWNLEPTVMPQQDPSKIFGVLYKTTKVNTFLAIIDGNGRIVSLATAGALGITHKPFRISHITSYKLARKVGAAAFKKGVRQISFFRKVGKSRFYKSNIVQGLRHEALALGWNFERFKQGIIKMFGHKNANREIKKAKKAGLIWTDFAHKNQQFFVPRGFFLKKVDQRPHNGTRLPKKKITKKHYSPSNRLYMRTPRYKKRYSTIFSLMGRLRQKQVSIPKPLWPAQRQTTKDVWAFFRSLYFQNSVVRTSVGSYAKLKVKALIPQMRSHFFNKYFIGNLAFKKAHAKHRFQKYVAYLEKQQELGLEDAPFDTISPHFYSSYTFGGQYYWPLGSKMIKKPLCHLEGSARLLPNRLQWGILKRTQFNHERRKQLARKKKLSDFRKRVEYRIWKRKFKNRKVSKPVVKGLKKNQTGFSKGVSNKKSFSQVNNSRKNKKAVFTKFRRNNKPVQKHTSRNITRRDTAKKNDKKHFKPKTKKN